MTERLSPSVRSPEALGAHIVALARELGFHRVGLAPVAESARHDLYRDWLAAGHHGEMAYLADPDYVHARKDPRVLLPEAKTIVTVALAYGGRDADAALVPLRTGPRGKIARYARGTDYHIVMKDLLTLLSKGLTALIGQPVLSRSCVDTAPLSERDEGERAGLGFVAKNTLLITPGLGSYVLLGEVLIAADARFADSDEKAASRKRCGQCRACLDACPTGAFVDAYVLDARRCISYLTIELTTAIPRELRPLMGQHIFGCDICQEVCPHNAGRLSGEAPPCAELGARSPDRGAPELIPLLSLGANQFRQFVKRSALRRLHRPQLLRNVCVALGNAGDLGAVPALRGALADRHALVRAHAAWALGRLGDAEGLRQRRSEEVDPAVLEEIDLALSELV